MIRSQICFIGVWEVLDLVDIYIKPKKKAELTGAGWVKVSDIADVYAPAAVLKRVESMHLLPVKHSGVHVVSVIDVVKAISQALPGHSVINLGEMDTMVSVKIEPPKKRKLIRFIKVALVALVLFIGSSTAIMAFHTDSQLGTVFKEYHKIFFGEQQNAERPLIINIPYSIGLAVGIVVFFNHFGGKRFSKEPTPIEVEIASYERDVADAVVDKSEE